MRERRAEQVGIAAVGEIAGSDLPVVLAHEAFEVLGLGTVTPVADVRDRCLQQCCLRLVGGRHPNRRYVKYEPAHPKLETWRADS